MNVPSLHSIAYLGISKMVVATRLDHLPASSPWPLLCVVPPPGGTSSAAPVALLLRRRKRPPYLSALPQR